MITTIQSDNISNMLFSFYLSVYLTKSQFKISVHMDVCSSNKIRYENVLLKQITNSQFVSNTLGKIIAALNTLSPLCDLTNNKIILFFISYTANCKHYKIKLDANQFQKSSRKHFNQVVIVTCQGYKLDSKVLLKKTFGSPKGN